MLEIKDLEVAYGDLEVIHGVTFKVNDREIVSLVGNNGAGKTTTMMAISGMLRVKKGSIIFRGEEITNKEPHEIVKKGMVHIPEGRELFPSLNVLENLALGSLIGPARLKRKENLEKVFTFFPVLKERGTQRAVTLSGGEQQMLAIGRGLMAEPVLLILDEPSLGLAPRLVDFLFETIVSINQIGVTILLVEQNVYYSLDISDDAFVMENGVITLYGPGKDLLGMPAIKKAYLSI